jgi:hypothetical protein
MIHTNDIGVVSSVVVSAATFIPSWRIFGRVGISRWWAFASFIPFFGTLVVLWIIAFHAWPKWSPYAPRP